MVLRVGAEGAGVVNMIRRTQRRERVTLHEHTPGVPAAKSRGLGGVDRCVEEFYVGVKDKKRRRIS